MQGSVKTTVIHAKMFPCGYFRNRTTHTTLAQSKQGRTLSEFQEFENSFLRSALLGRDNNHSFSLENGGVRVRKRNERAVVSIALSRKKDSLLSVNEASFDQNSYSTNF